jgi:predicted dienelactone hydrolase
MTKIGFNLLLLFVIMVFFESSPAAKHSSQDRKPEQLYTHQPTVAPELSSFGEYTVGVQTITTTNPGQISTEDFSSKVDRPLTLEVWYPSQHSNSQGPTSYKNVTRSGQAIDLQGFAYRDLAPLESLKSTSLETSHKFPLVVISHGYTGYRTIMFYLAEHLASHGYVVAAIDHTDSTNAEIDFVKASGAGFPSTLINRARDQQFVLDYFSNNNSPLSNIVNTDSASIVGYSMGGYGALNTVGACYSFSAETLQGFGMPAQATTALLPVFNSCNAGRQAPDRRWKAMLAFAPWGGEQNVHSPESLAKIKIPSMFVSGSEDDISGYRNGVRKLFDLTGSPDKYLMVYQNARHNIAAHPAPQVAYDNDLDIGHHYEPSWNIETINLINMHMSLVFLNCHIKGVESACRYLPVRERITQTKQADGSLSSPWPGFKPRWGNGVRFYRSNTKLD